MDDVTRIRDRIDQLDLEIVRLLKARCENAKLLGRIKSQRRLEFRDPQREEIILRKVENAATGFGLDWKLTRPIFEQIFSLSVQAQKDHSSQIARKLDRTRILIIGGTGGMGRLFARFTSLQGARVKLAGREIDRTRAVAGEMEVEPGTILDATSSDMVILAVPMGEMVRVATETVPLMSPGSLLADLSSVKTGISDRIAENIPKNLEYVSLHPLFGSSIDHLYDQVIVSVPYHAGQKWSTLARAFRSVGSKIVRMSASQHDRTMAYIQGLHHYALISLGLGLDGKGGEPRTQSLRDTEARIVALLDNWDTITGIQQLNPFVGEVREKFVEGAAKLARVRWEKSAGLKRKLSSNVQKWSRKL